MGHGGCSPDYFQYRMKWWEAMLYMKGVQEKEHAAWERERQLEWAISCIMSGEGKAPKSPQSLYLFPWEDAEEADQQSTVMTDEKKQDLVDLLRKVKAENEKARTA